MQVGSGFVVAHLPNGDWSAPAFFKWHAAGGGITLGARTLTAAAAHSLCISRSWWQAQYQCSIMSSGASTEHCAVTCRHQQGRDGHRPEHRQVSL